MAFPKVVDHVQVPPIKCQGIKTKLVNFIYQNIEWNEEGRWIEPFIGSGVILFNTGVQRALVSDTNQHIIRLYQGIQSGEINGLTVREHLEREGAILLETEGEHYYTVRNRFNEQGDPLDFLFLNRSCFNGMMRFNKSGGFNVPFCRKPERFRPALVTKIVNQVNRIQAIMEGKDWVFVCQPWQETLSQAEANDFVYLDPPYIGRYADYYNQWDEQEATDLAQAAHDLPCGYALSMWQENLYRRNDHLDIWQGEVRTMAHFYHVGATEALRNEMQEALVIKEGYAAEIEYQPQPRTQLQLNLGE